MALTIRLRQIGVVLSLGLKEANLSTLTVRPIASGVLSSSFKENPIATAAACHRESTRKSDWREKAVLRARLGGREGRERTGTVQDFERLAIEHGIA